MKRKNKNNDSSARTCCIIDCPNTSTNNDASVQFYELPDSRYRSYQRTKCGQAMPAPGFAGNSKISDYTICSKHFVTGTPNQNPKSVDYIPTVFPDPEPPTRFRKKEETVKLRSISVKQFALEYIKHDALLEKPTKDNINSMHRRWAYVKLARTLHITIPMVKSWEYRLRSHFNDRLAMTVVNKNGKLCLGEGAPQWVRDVERRLNLLPSFSASNVSGCGALSAGGVVRALCAAARARAQLCSSGLYGDVRRMLKLSCTVNDLHAVWVSAQRISVEQVLVCARGGDRPPAPDDAARVADLVLLHTDLDMHRLVTDESVVLYEELAALHALWLLVQRHRLEESAPRASRVHQQRWTRAYWEYLDSGRSASLVVLQRRWHELKLQARDRVRAYWSRAAATAPAAPDDAAPTPAPVRPAQLHLAILKRYPHIVTEPFRSWRQRVLDGDIVTEPLTDVEEHKEESEASSSSLVEPAVDDVTGGASERGLTEPTKVTDTYSPTAPQVKMSDSDAEDNLVIDDSAQHALKQEHTTVKEEHSVDTDEQNEHSVATHDVVEQPLPTIAVLTKIDPSTVKTEILFESDDDNEPYDEKNTVETPIKIKKDPDISNRLVFEDPIDDVMDDADIKLDIGVINDSVALGSDVKPCIEDVTSGNDVTDDHAWGSDQNMDELTTDGNIEDMIDPKLLMEASVNLIKIDATPAWKKYSQHNSCILVSKLFGHQPSGASTCDVTQEIKLDDKQLERAANTANIRQFCRNIKIELMEEQLAMLGEEIPNKPANTKKVNKKVKKDSDSDYEASLTSNSSSESDFEEEFFNYRKRKSKAVRAVTSRRHKRVRLPDIEHVRRVNSRMLTAQVAPLTAAEPDKDVETYTITMTGDDSFELSLVNQPAVEHVTTEELPEVEVSEAEMPDTEVLGVEVPAAEVPEPEVPVAEVPEVEVFPTDEQLTAVLAELTSVTEAEKMLDTTHCCAARRHRVVNDTRRQYNFPEIPLHNHPDGECTCCCAHLCDSGARTRLHAQLQQLHQDITSMLRGTNTNTTNKVKKKKKKKSRKSSPSSKPSAPTKQHKPAPTDNTTDQPDGTTDVPTTKDTETEAKQIEKTKTKPSHRSRGKQNVTDSEPPTAPATQLDGYEEWLRQKNLNTQYFHFTTNDNSSTTKHTSNKKPAPKGTAVQSTAAQNTAAQNTAAQSTTPQSITLQSVLSGDIPSKSAPLQSIPPSPNSVIKKNAILQGLLLSSSPSIYDLLQRGSPQSISSHKTPPLSTSSRKIAPKPKPTTKSASKKNVSTKSISSSKRTTSKQNISLDDIAVHTVSAQSNSSDSSTLPTVPLINIKAESISPQNISIETIPSEDTTSSRIIPQSSAAQKNPQQNIVSKPTPPQSERLSSDTNDNKQPQTKPRGVLMSPGPVRVGPSCNKTKSSTSRDIPLKPAQSVPNPTAAMTLTSVNQTTTIEQVRQLGNQEVSTVIPPPEKNVSILEEYSRTLAAEGTHPPLPAVNALTLHVPSPQGPRTTIIMSVSLPPGQSAINKPLLVNDTVDLTEDSETPDPKDSQRKTHSRVQNIANIVSRLAQPLSKITGIQNPRIAADDCNRVFEGTVIEVDDSSSSDSNQSSNVSNVARTTSS